MGNNRLICQSGTGHFPPSLGGQDPQYPGWFGNRWHVRLGQQVIGRDIGEDGDGRKLRRLWAWSLSSKFLTGVARCGRVPYRSVSADAETCGDEHQQEDEIMSKASFERGVRDGRVGRDPSPPTFNPLLDPMFGASKSDIEKGARDYKSGYVSGSQQRAADSAKSQK
jgi:hypothetical protein